MDRLEELVDRGWRLPVGRKVLVDEEMVLNIIDQLRICVPQEIKEAAELLARRDRILADAQEQARRVIVQARDEAARMLDEDEVRTRAREDADAMVRDAREHAARVIDGADRYAEEQLMGLERTVGDLERVIQRGLETLATRRAQREAEERAAQEQPALDEDDEVEAEATLEPDAADSPSGDEGVLETAPEP